jgi:transcriptional regulator CtsR
MLPIPFTEAAQAETGESALQDLFNGADSIIVGTVVEHSSYWNEEHTGIYTTVILSVEESLKGAIIERITVILPGGEVDGMWEWVSSMPSFEQGEKVVVFLRKLSKAQLPEAKDSKVPLPEEQFEVYGGFRGKFTVAGDKVGDLPLAQFKERVNKVLKGQTLTYVESDVPLSVATFLYSYAGFCWPHPPAPVVNYRINENCADCTGEGAAVQAAAATWNAAGAQFSFSYAGTTAVAAYSYDGVNEILWRNLGSGGPIAQAVIWYTGSTILECDMEFNDYYTFSAAAIPSAGRYDTQTIALHEFGHFLCLDDLYNPADSDKVMYGYGSPGTTKRALHADDIAGIRYIYGASPTLPNPPSNLITTPISSSRIDLSWQDNSDNETGFKIERRTSSGSYSQMATVGASVTSYSNTGLSTSTTYYYRVRAYSAAGDSPYSNEASATTLPPPPSAPTLKSPASASTVPNLTPRLEWNGSSGAVSYGVQVSTSSSFAGLLVNETGITNLYHDIAPGILNWNTTYYWRVNARDSFGSTSTWSSYWYFETAVGPPPDAPSNLIATPISSSRIDLTWQDNSSDESGFKIERKTGSGSYSQIATVGAGVTSYSNSGLSTSTTYYYRVRGYNAAGNSGYSNEASAITLPPPPAAPTLKSPASASIVPSLTPRLEWNASSGAISYGLQVSTTSGFTNLLVNDTGITDLYYDIAPGILNWNTTYYWRVNARDSFGSTSSWSTSRYFNTAVGPPPNAPSNLVATPISSSQIDLSWQDNSSDETGFKIERKTGSGSYSQIATIGAGVTSYSNSGLSTSTTYYYRVRAYNAVGNSEYSSEASAATLPPPPPAPTLKSPASASTAPNLTPRLEWNASSGAVSYGVQVSTSFGFTTLIVNETGITDLYYDVPGGILNWNTTYYWRVNARNSYGGTSSWSSYRYFRTAIGPPPEGPSNLVATAISSSRIDLTWQDNSSDETGFKIERKTGTGSYSQIATVGAGVTSYSNTGLSAGTTYYYRVRAYKGTLNSDYCEEASATTLPPPPAVPTLKSPASASTAPNLTPRLEWNASSGAVSYGVQVSTSFGFTTLIVNETGITDLYYDVPGGILNWNTTYYWRVNARNSFGSTSSWSSYRYFRTPAES